MVTFETQDLIYLDYQEKSTKTGGITERVYFIYRFQDQQTKRQILVYDWSQINLAGELKQGERYYTRGYVNTRGGQNFLVLTEIAKVEKGKLMEIYRNEEGITKIESAIK
jgi:hypothetical protein